MDLSNTSRVMSICRCRLTSSDVRARRVVMRRAIRSGATYADLRLSLRHVRPFRRAAPHLRARCRVALSVMRQARAADTEFARIVADGVHATRGAPGQRACCECAAPSRTGVRMWQQRETQAGRRSANRIKEQWRWTAVDDQSLILFHKSRTRRTFHAGRTFARQLSASSACAAERAFVGDRRGMRRRPL